MHTIWHSPSPHARRAVTNTLYRSAITMSTTSRRRRRSNRHYFECCVEASLPLFPRQLPWATCRMMAIYWLPQKWHDMPKMPCRPKAAPHIGLIYRASECRCVDSRYAGRDAAFWACIDITYHMAQLSFSFGAERHSHRTASTYISPPRKF